jgi:hypothetical protein
VSAARRVAVMSMIVLAAVLLSADDAYARRRRGFRSSRPLTAGEACCLLPIVAFVVIAGGVSKAHRRGQGFTSMGRHRRW